MGCPDIYYKKALQFLAYGLAVEENRQLANKMFDEASEEELEQFVLTKRNQMEDKEFYYQAGRVTEIVLDDAQRTGCDALNASICGLAEFEYFIGIREDEEEGDE